MHGQQNIKVYYPNLNVKIMWFPFNIFEKSPRHWNSLIVFLKTRVASCYILSTTVSVQYIYVHHLQHIIFPTCYRSYSEPHTSINLNNPKEKQDCI